MITLRYPPLYSGAALQATHVVRGLLREGVQITVLTAYRGRPPAEFASYPDGTRVVRMATPGGLWLRHGVFGLRAALWLLRHREWDLVHLIDFHYFALLPTLIAKLLGRPVLTKTTLLSVGSDSPGARLLRAVQRWGYRSSAAIVALSDALASALVRDGVAEERILRLPNGVDMDRFRPADPAERRAARRDFGLPEDAWVVVSAGMLLKRKNPDVLVRAAARMRARPVHVVLAGAPGSDDAYAAELEQAIAACPEGITVHRPGSLPAERVAELLRAADVFVLASSSEGMPNSLLEAMAAGLACVATDIPGSRDVLDPGSGTLVSSGDPDALAAALDAYAESPELRARHGAAARQVVASRYSLAYVTSRYLETYRALIDADR